MSGERDITDRYPHARDQPCWPRRFRPDRWCGNFLLALQRALGRQKGAVFEGRDMGTVVFPDADVKFYLDAASEIRADRRYRELKADSRVTRAEVARDDSPAGPKRQYPGRGAPRSRLPMPSGSIPPDLPRRRGGGPDAGPCKRRVGRIVGVMKIIIVLLSRLCYIEYICAIPLHQMGR